MRESVVKILIGQILRYTSVGVLNSLVGLGIIWGAMAMGTGSLMANVYGYTVGLILSFTLNRRWTFRSVQNQSLRDQVPLMARFLAAFAIAWGVNLMCLTAGLQLTSLSPYALQVIAMGTYTIAFFVLCRVFVFVGIDHSQ